MRRKQKNNMSFLMFIIILVVIALKFVISYACFFLGLAVVAIMIKLYLYIQAEKRSKALMIADIDNMSGIDFEYYVQKILEHQGYDATVTKASGDLGADVIATIGDMRYSIQVKRYSYAVDRKAVSDAVGAKEHYNCNQAMVITNNYFTPGAKELAKSTRCVLVDRDQLSSWIAEYHSDEKDSIIKGIGNGYYAAFAVLTIVLIISLINGISSLNTSISPTAQNSAAIDPSNPKSSAIQAYSTYTNPRFGYSIPIPKDFIAEPEPTNGDGKAFHSQDGKCKISAWGSHFPQAMGYSNRQCYEYTLLNTNGEITYKMLGANWYVISGYKGDNIFYQKTFVDTDENTFLIEYPKTQKEKYSDMAIYLEKTFKPATKAPSLSEPINPSQTEINEILRKTTEQDNPSAYFVAGSPLITTSDNNNGWISAVVGTRYPSADGYRKLVFFWHNDEFIGWDSVYESISPSISAYGPGYFEISYPHYANGDPLANPSLPNVKVIYQWNNKNFTAQGSPPQDNFGKTAQPIRVKYLN